jgi:hypothetical protein
MPTLGEHLAASFGRPEIAEQLERLVEPIGVVRTEHQNLFLGVVLVAGAIAQRAQENFPSKAYWQYFRDHGVNPVLARPVGSLTISIGTRRAHESRQLGAVVKAFKFLARRNRQKRAIRSRAKGAARRLRRDVNCPPDIPRRAVERGGICESIEGRRQRRAARARPDQGNRRRCRAVASERSRTQGQRDIGCTRRVS